MISYFTAQSQHVFVFADEETGLAADWKSSWQIIGKSVGRKEWRKQTDSWDKICQELFGIVFFQAFLGQAEFIILRIFQKKEKEEVSHAWRAHGARETKAQKKKPPRRNRRPLLLQLTGPYHWEKKITPPYKLTNVTCVFSVFGCFRKYWGFPPRIIPFYLGFSIIFTSHFGGFTPYFWKHPDPMMSKHHSRLAQNCVPWVARRSESDCWFIYSSMYYEGMNLLIY